MSSQYHEYNTPLNFWYSVEFDSNNFLEGKESLYCLSAFNQAHKRVSHGHDVIMRIVESRD
jgi:hypothetical protein